MLSTCRCYRWHILSGRQGTLSASYRRNNRRDSCWDISLRAKIDSVYIICTATRMSRCTMCTMSGSRHSWSEINANDILIIQFRFGSERIKNEKLFLFWFLYLESQWQSRHRWASSRAQHDSSCFWIYLFIYSFLASWTILDDINKSFTYRFAFLEESKRLLKSTSVSGHEKICCWAYVCGRRRSQHSVNIPPSITEYKKRASQLKAHTHERRLKRAFSEWLSNHSEGNTWESHRRRRQHVTKLSFFTRNEKKDEGKWGESNINFNLRIH